MNYSELLLDEKWKLKRNEIVKRDLLKCKNCNNQRLLQGQGIKMAYLSYSSIGKVFNNNLVFGKEIPGYYNIAFIEIRYRMLIVI
jgi:hypothetical protein